MPQIPVFGGSQRLNVSSPVPVASAEGTAGNLTGNAAEGFGKALFQLGNMLDEAGRKAKDEADKLTVKIAVNKARFAMLEEKARQEAAGIQAEDRPDGFSGVQRFKENVDPKLAAIAEQLPDEKLKGMFFSEIGDDFVRDSTLVLADEVKKRESALPLLRQDNINGKAALARADFSKVFPLMQEIEADILNDNSIAGEQKPKFILDAKKQIAKESLAGFIDKGNTGQPAGFAQARAALKDNFAQIFKSDEMEKELNAINAAENAFYTRDWQVYTRNQRLAEDSRKKQERDAITEYTSALAVAGNSQFAFNAVQKRIQLDPRLSGEAVKRLQDTRSFMETKDDDYEGVFMTELLKKKNFGVMIDKVNADYIGNKVSSDRRDKLLKAVENMQESNRKDPFLMATVNQARDEINNYKKPPAFDPVSGLYKQENDTYNEKAQTIFMQRITAMAQRGNLTPGAVVEMKNGILREYYGGETVKKPVPGVSPENLTTTKGIQNTLDEAYKEYKTKGKTWSPEQRKQKMQQIKGLIENKQDTQRREQLKINPSTNSAPSKVFDE